MSILFKDFSVSFGETRVFSNFSIEFEGGKTVCLLGGSGVGKTTLLRAVAGVVKYGGSIDTGGLTGVSFCFQNDRLLDNLTVYGNLDVVLRAKIARKEERRRRIAEVMKRAEIDGYADRFPRELSGGTKRRVALCRAFCFESDIMLLDEAFTGVDVAMKGRLVSSFNDMLEGEARQRTVICVTHDPDTALMLADRVVVLRGDPCEAVYSAEITLPKAERTPAHEELNRIRDGLYSAIK